MSSSYLICIQYTICFTYKEITGCDEQTFISTTVSYTEGNKITTKNRCEGIRFTFKDINCTTSVMLLIIQVCKNTKYQATMQIDLRAVELQSSQVIKTIPFVVVGEGRRHN